MSWTPSLTYKLELGTQVGERLLERKSLKFSRDGAFISEAVAPPKSSRIWNARTGELIREFVDPNPTVLSMQPSFSDDCVSLAFGYGCVDDDEAGILLVNTNTGDPARGCALGSFVTLLDFSPKGRFLFFANSESDRAGTDHAGIIDVATGELALRLDGDGLKERWDVSYVASSAVVSGNERVGAVGFDGGSVLVWRERGRRKLKSGAEIPSLQIKKRLPSCSYGVCSADFSADGAAVLTIGGDGVATVWDAVTGAEVGRMVHSRSLRGGIVNSTGSRVLTTCVDGFVRLWDVAQATVLAELKTVLSNECGAVFTDDGCRFACCVSDGRIEVRSSRTGDLLAVSEPNEGSVTQLSFLEDGRVLIVSTLSDVRVLEASSGVTLSRFDGRLLALSDDHRVLAYGDYRGTWVASILSGEINWDVRVEARFVAFSPGAERLFLYSAADDKILDLDVTSGLPMGSFGGRDWDSLEAITFSPDGGRILLISSAGGSDVPEASGVLCEVATGEVIADFDPSTALVFSPDGEYLCRSQVDGGIAIHSSESGETVAEFNTCESETARPHAVRFSPDGSRVLACLSNGQAVSWTFADDESFFLSGHRLPRIRPTEITDDGRVLTIDEDGGLDDNDDNDDDDDYGDENEGDALADDADGGLGAGERLGAIRIWSPEGRELAVSPERLGRGRSAAFVPVGEWVAVLTTDGRVRLWNTSNDEVRYVEMPDNARVETLHVNSKGGAVAGLCDDGAARIWAVPTGELTAVLSGHETCPEAFLFCDDDRVMTVSKAMVRVWEVPRL